MHWISCFKRIQQRNTYEQVSNYIQSDSELHNDNVKGFVLIGDRRDGMFLISTCYPSSILGNL